MLAFAMSFFSGRFSAVRLPGSEGLDQDERQTQAVQNRWEKDWKRPHFVTLGIAIISLYYSFFGEVFHIYFESIREYISGNLKAVYLPEPYACSGYGLTSLYCSNALKEKQYIFETLCVFTCKSEL